jgi:hypothetical protein
MARVRSSLRTKGGRLARHLAAFARDPVGVLRRRSFQPPLRPTSFGADTAHLSRTPEDTSFITGNGIASRCRYVLNYDEFSVNGEVENDWYFCKVDFIDYFFEHHAPGSEFVLFSHNGDAPIGGRYRRYLRRPELRAWFATNVELRHPALFPIPIGIANPRWAHGDLAAFRRVQEAGIAKSRLFDASYSTDTNSIERRYCLEQTGVPLPPRKPFGEYLADLASASFCISPRGNGVDCHRTWEALYLRAIPIVIRSLLNDHHPDIPMIVLDDWSEFRAIEFSPELYERTWNGFCLEELSLDSYLGRVERTLAGSRR